MVCTIEDIPEMSRNVTGIAEAWRQSRGEEGSGFAKLDFNVLRV